jgi:hypothetical protein
MTIRSDATRTRIRIKEKRRPRAVVARQGQVLLDTDFDQQARHHLERLEIETLDTLGSPGRFLVPGGNTGFRVTAATPPINASIGFGRGYLDGWLLENVEQSTPCNLATQPHPRTGDTVTVPAVFAIKALIRHVDPAEEPKLADPALGDAQASGRALIDWQVFPLNLSETVSCATVLASATWQALSARSIGMLTVLEQAATPSTDPCSLTPGGGYTRLENLLYRFEVHGGDTHPTFPTIDGPRFKLHNLKIKFSRRNASVMVRIKSISDASIKVEPPSLDPRNWFAPGQYAEVVSIHDDVDPRAALANERMFRVAKADDELVVIEATAAEISATGATGDGTWFLRLWDAFPDGKGIATISAPGTAAESAEIDLGDGLKLKFGMGGLTGFFRRGDYWNCAARADGTTDWPKTGTAADLMRPHGPEIRYAPLAMLTGSSTSPGIEDCRIPFATLSDRLLLYRGGDGQGVFPPSGAGMVQLPAPLRVAVMRGETPVPGATIRWSFGAPTGGSSRINGAICDATHSPETTTDANGLAEVTWEIDASKPHDLHQVQAALSKGATMALEPPLVFNAAFETARRTAYAPGKCDQLADVTNVQDAIDALCSAARGGCCVTVGESGGKPTLDEALEELLKNKRDICICLLPGDHRLRSDLRREAGGLRLMIHGAGRASRLDLEGHRFELTGLTALHLRDFDIADTRAPLHVRIEDCYEVGVQNMSIGGISDEQRSVLHIQSVDLAELVSNSVSSYTREGLRYAIELVRRLPLLKDHVELMFKPAHAASDVEISRKVGEAIAEASPSDRRRLHKTIDELVGTQITNQERQALAAFQRELIIDKPRAGRLAGLLTWARQSLLLSQGGLALAIGGADARILLSDNRINGRLSVYGEATSPASNLNEGHLRALDRLLKDAKAKLVASRGDLRLRNNRLRDIRIGDELLRGVLEVINNGGGTIADVHASLIADSNTITGPESHLLAVNLAVSQNVLEPFRDVGVAIARQAKYIGNFADNDFRLFNVGNKPADFGNGALSVVTF